MKQHSAASVLSTDSEPRSQTRSGSENPGFLPTLRKPLRFLCCKLDPQVGRGLSWDQPTPRSVRLVLAKAGSQDVE